MKETAKIAADKLVDEGYEKSSIAIQLYLNLRFVGTDTARFIPGSVIKYNQLFTDEKESESLSDIYNEYHTLFIQRYRKEFGFVLDRDINVDDIRCRATSSGKVVQCHTINTRPKDKPLDNALKLPSWTSWFDVPGQGIKRLNTKVYDINDLYAEDIIYGPALILQNTSTIVIEPKCNAEITKEGNICITIGESEPEPVTTELDNIQLAIFGHRFMSIAEQMGRALQRTSVSTNIKERLDFSCAIFGPKGIYLYLYAYPMNVQ